MRNEKEKDQSLPWIAHLRGIDQISMEVAGGKAYNLEKLIRKDYRAPASFVITTSVFDKVLKASNVYPIEPSVFNTEKGQLLSDLNRYSKRISDIVANVNIPDEMVNEFQKFIKDFKDVHSIVKFAVRSSANVEDSYNASFAGLFDSYLCIESIHDIVQRVKQCWASMYSLRVLMYCRRKEIPHKTLKMGVLVQEMIEGETSGVVFTVNPITRDQHTMLIEACKGTGDNLVSGIVSPCRFEVSKHNFDIREVSKPSEDIELLTRDKVAQIADTALRIEREFGFPQDIEWTFNGDSLFILQSRPITTI